MDTTDDTMTIEEWTAEYGPTVEEREADKARHSLTEYPIDGSYLTEGRAA